MKLHELKFVIYLFLLLLFLALLASSCTHRPTFIHPDLSLYHSRFIVEAKRRGIDCDSGGLTLTFEKTVHSGIAIRHSHGGDVYIDSTSHAWKVYPEQLVFHELGHYYLGRGHDLDMNFDGSPKSLMHPHVLPYYDYYPGSNAYAIRQRYIEELFK